MHIEGDVITWSASELARASACEFGFLRDLDARQGRIAPLPDNPDAMLERTSVLGAQHEQRVLERYRHQHGDAVVVIPRPDRAAGVTTAEAHRLTREALTHRAPVVAQAALESVHDGARYVGYADFVVLEADGTYRVEDTKLARSAKVTALLQLAAYAEALEAMGMRVHPTVSLVLGDGTRTDYSHADIAPVLHLRRDRLLAMVRERQRDGATNGPPVAWNDPRYTICGACPHCETEIEATDDILTVATLSRGQRERLHAAGIVTTADLAARTGPVPGIGRETLDRLREQARLQASATRGAPPRMRWWMRRRCA
ncbi:hypothetical protein GCM10025873_13300 [Demequina sediminis]|uniref:PD-(D/E)XK nuclease family protein n=1 Tax=Demequina sediminis TaxID=1930058 RepID=UPI003305D987|nr:hypothetical protein GCM10025873_13300 [Demequina sediminis]